MHPTMLTMLFQAIDVDLTPFAAAPHNGKLIHYVGWADQLISVGNSLHYYGTVKNFTESNTNLKIDDFYRFFPVAGMLHWYVYTLAMPFSYRFAHSLFSAVRLLRMDVGDVKT